MQTNRYRKQTIQKLAARFGLEQAGYSTNGGVERGMFFNKSQYTRLPSKLLCDVEIEKERESLQVIYF
jgi:hypothetical protein